MLDVNAAADNVSFAQALRVSRRQKAYSEADQTWHEWYKIGVSSLAKPDRTRHLKLLIIVLEVVRGLKGYNLPKTQRGD